MWENHPVSKIRMRSPGDSVLASAASQLPVPDEGKIDDRARGLEDVADAVRARPC